VRQVAESFLVSAATVYKCAADGVPPHLPIVTSSAFERMTSAV